MKSVSGVYKITCLKNGMIYIGSSKNIRSRLSSHKYNLKNNSHHNHYLQEDFNLYGINNFKFEILETCNDEYLELEQKYLDELEPFFKLGTGYNINEKSSGVNTTGFRFFTKGGKCYVKQNGYRVPMPITFDEYYSKSREELCEECEGFTTLDYLEEDMIMCNPDWE
jgi:group I intron endonuclease